MRSGPAFALVSLALAVLQPTSAVAADFYESDALVLNLTLEDLNRVARDALQEDLGNRLEGTRTRASRGVFDLRYYADLGDPLVTLDGDGRLLLSLAVREGRIEVGRFEREILKRKMLCEGGGVRVLPEDPLAVSLALRLEVEDGSLQFVPEAASVTSAKKGLRLVRPSRCQNNVLPEWVLWQLGKPHLRRQLARIDEILLDRAQKSAAALNGDPDLLHKQWNGEGGALRLSPSSVDTRQGSVLVRLAGSSAGPAPASAGVADWDATVTKTSFIALSEPFLGAALGILLDPGSHTFEAGRSIRRMFESDEIFTLIPGLREVEHRERLRFSLAFPRAPRIELGSAGPPTIRLDVSGLELGLWETGDVGDARLGRLRVEEGSLELLPYAGSLGGISFEILANDWSLSSEGLEINDPLIAATLQELVFGEIFEIRYEPLLRDALHIGSTRFVPRDFRRVGRYLVIEVAAGPAAALVAQRD